MATFTNFSDLLPDPDNKISSAGASDASGTAGPGFVRIKFRSNKQAQRSRTISGRGVGASPYVHYWSFDISYNPMTKTEFRPIDVFLESREGFKPFYIILPQHTEPADSTFATYVASNNISPVSDLTAGVTNFMIQGLSGVSGDPTPGDFFNIVDPSDVNHTKAYKITRVETNTTYQTGSTQPSTTQRRIHISPPLARNVTASGTVLDFLDPKFRVRQTSDVHEYDLDTDNLYQYSLSVEEILP